MDPLQIDVLLKKKKATKAAIAETLGVSPQTVGSVISGKSKSRRIARVVADFLGTSVDVLWPGQYPERYRRKSSAQVERDLMASALRCGALTNREAA